MTDYPEAAREWNTVPAHTKGERRLAEAGDAAIEALENRIRDLERELAMEEERADKAEAALAKCEQQKRGLATAAKTGMVAGNRVIELEAKLAAAEATIERLKCCGSCGYLFDDCGQGLCGWANPSPTQVGSPHVNFADPCFRAPSRWKEAER